MRALNCQDLIKINGGRRKSSSTIPIIEALERRSGGDFIEPWIMATWDSEGRGDLAVADGEFNQLFNAFNNKKKDLRRR